jgi:hypothetical protein
LDPCGRRLGNRGDAFNSACEASGDGCGAKALAGFLILNYLSDSTPCALTSRSEAFSFDMHWLTVEYYSFGFQKRKNALSASLTANTRLLESAEGDAKVAAERVVADGS